MATKQQKPAESEVVDPQGAVTPGSEPNVTASEPEEWLRAKRDLYVGHVRAVSAGDLVHASTVENNGWDDDVEKAEPAGE